LPDTIQDQLKNEIKSNLEEEDNYEYGYRINDFWISKEAKNEEDCKMNIQQFWSFMPMLLFGKARIIYVNLGEWHYRDMSVLNKNFPNKDKLY
jgi:hypothetical protein